MSQEHSISGAAVDRVREVAAAFVETDLVRLRVEREGEAIELRRSVPVRGAAPVPALALPYEVSSNGTPKAVETIKADLAEHGETLRPDNVVMEWK